MWKFLKGKKGIEKGNGEKIPMVNKNKVIKSSRGIIEESTVYGVGYGESYVDKIFQLSGLTNAKIWECYWKNAWVRACTDKIIKEVCKYKIIIKAKESSDDKKDNKKIEEKINEIQALLDNPNPKVESFNAIRRKYLRDILIYDAGALEIVKASQESKQLKVKLKVAVEKLTMLTLKSKQKNQKDLSESIKINNKTINDIKAKIIKAEVEENKNPAKPKELYDIAGQDIKVNVDKHGNFKTDSAYKLLFNGVKVADFQSDELIYFVANPIAGSVYGLSPIESVYNTIIADNQAAILNRRRLENDGMISGVLSFPGMAEKKLKRNMLFWKAQAKNKAGRFVVTSNKDVSFTKLTESPEEMQFMEYQRWILNKIMAVYGMQPIVLGIIDVGTGKLNSEEQRRQFTSDAIIPLLTLESHHLTEVLIRQGFGYDDIEISYEKPKQELTLTEVSKILNDIGKLGIISINEAREMLGYSKLEEGGDALLVPSQLRELRETIERDGRKAKLDDIKERIDSILIDITKPSEVITEE